MKITHTMFEKIRIDRNLFAWKHCSENLLQERSDIVLSEKSWQFDLIHHPGFKIVVSFIDLLLIKP